MPSNLSMLSDNFPAFTGRETTEEKVETIQDYLFQLLENLRYTLGNLDEDNFNEGGLEGLAQIITKPLVVQLGEMGEGMASLSVTMEGIATRVDDIEGNYTTITQTAEGLILKAGNDESKSYMVVTQEGLNSAVSGLVTDGELSQAVSTGITQTMNSITMQVVSNASGTYMTMTDGNFSIESPTMDIHVDALNIHGEVHADVINANSEIISPVIYSPDGRTYLQMDDVGGISIGSSARTDPYTGNPVPLLTLVGEANGGSTVSLTGYDTYNQPTAYVTLQPNYETVQIGRGLRLTQGYGYGTSLPSSGIQGQVFFLI